MEWKLKSCSETIDFAPALAREQIMALPYAPCLTKDRTEYRRHKRERLVRGTHLDAKTHRSIWVFSEKIAIHGSISPEHAAVARTEAKAILGPGVVFSEPTWTFFLSRAEAPRPPAEVLELVVPMLSPARGNFGGSFQFNPSVKILTFRGNNHLFVMTSNQTKEFHDDCCTAIGQLFV